jgi:hypothetical protein
MRRDRKVDKKPYRAPSLVALDLGAAKALLKAKGHPRDPVVPGRLFL